MWHPCAADFGEPRGKRPRENPTERVTLSSRSHFLWCACPTYLSGIRRAWTPHRACHLVVEISFSVVFLPYLSLSNRGGRGAPPGRAGAGGGGGGRRRRL